MVSMGLIKTSNMKKRGGAHWIMMCIIALFVPFIAFATNPNDNSKKNTKNVTTKTVAKKKSTVVKPTIQDADHADKGRVFLEEADSLLRREGTEFFVLIGKSKQVKFRHGEMYMTCDSAHFYDTQNSFKAYGKVHVWEGDTLHVYGDSLNYDGNLEYAMLYAFPGNKAKGVHKGSTLESDILHYNFKEERLFYTTPGVLIHQDNKLTSNEGQYSFITEQAEAFGNVVLESKAKGKTTFIRTEELIYNKISGIANIDTDAIIENEDAIIHTSSADYNTNTHIAQLKSAGSTITSKKDGAVIVTDFADYNTSTNIAQLLSPGSTITSEDGTVIYTDLADYNTETGLAQLLSPSEIVSPDGTIHTTFADYNTKTHLARLKSPSTITNKDGVIETTNGEYNTETRIANLYDHSYVRTNDNKTLEGDTLFYDRNNGYGEAYGNMILIDHERQMMLEGDYGYYNEVIDSAFVTGKALAREYSKEDTIYMHGDTIIGFRVFNKIEPKDSTQEARIDTSHIVVVNRNVRIFRNDIQGVCDSMTFRQQDSLLFMHKHPIIWSGKPGDRQNPPRQIFGNVIEIHFNDSTADWARLPDFGFATELVEGNFYNQMSGTEMIATFENQSIKTLNINGNVQAIYLPMENDSTYNKIVNVESSFLEAFFNEQNLEKCKIWAQSSGTVTPLYLAKKSLFFLPKFKWYEAIRPKYPMDVFNVSPEMEELLNSAPSTPTRRTLSR